MFFAVLVIFPSCTSNKIEQPSFRLVEFMSIFTAPGTNYVSYIFPINVCSGCCVIEYNSGRVSKVVYKNSVPVPINFDGTLPKPKDSYYEFVYTGNKVVLTKKIDNYTIPYSPEKRELILDQKDRIICRIVGKDTTDFFYSQKGLLSKSIQRNGGYSVVERNFFFDSRNNLVHIKGFIDNAIGRDIQIFEYFEEYDNAVNGFRNLGVIEGAFIRSLSQNNFSVYSSASYENKTMLDTMKFTLPITYHTNGDPIYGVCPSFN
ncbi:MAG TPA: hypothetical protein DEO54_05485 [Rikenellaceae bacterium]|nr:MAG: hypothetical protein A2X20_01320 [Bacteroidetes bacterium GWE2_40_15]HBZ25679.1 hypothetical protein [Rikenellaceae bacterium]